MTTMKTPWNSFRVCLVAAIVALVGGCQDDGSDDEGGDDGATSNGDGDGDGDDASSNDDGPPSADGADDGGAACSDACTMLATDPSCGFDAASCMESCTEGACAACLAGTTECGADCVDTCSGAADGGESGDDGNPPAPECVGDDECGLSFECVSCNLTDGQGWCEQTMACSFDADCGLGGKCGYSVVSGEYRCLPAENCG
jgi:hypothetical protein